jgi:hypothetical protein
MCRHMPLYEGMHVCQLYLRRYMPVNEGMHMMAVLAILAQTHASI